ncbi:LOW QUALITY PROTEIN: uncharacterized protein At4g17910-like [Neltuma alba]|uniref:LOW QUALITY PROTEIN: uncharacterized protein At4g17910-like n=1 Tax=Neltuma alba TaxID=207710 RepID=UPI0010A4223A|nr:LOW QUALITY PROTEIN: uncharacterized protein At4g17910-like [Prosopis alba]
MDSYKLEKEKFVTNLTGSSMLEIAVLTMTIPLLAVFRHSTISNSIAGGSLKKTDDAVAESRNLKTYLTTLCLDYLVIILPVSAFGTVLADRTYIGSFVIVLFTLISVAAKRCKYGGSSLSFEGDSRSLRAYISSYRFIVMIITCACILAVDFRIFPRRFAKTETYGTSLMDLGVGSFVVVNSFVSRQARNIISTGWKTAVLSTIPLIILGFIRIVTTTGINYQLHVSEYGVHWNFFFTLAGISILTSVVNIPAQYSGILGSLVLIGYQLCLLRGLNNYLLSDERGTDIISQNKEGLFSLFGYWGMYLIGVHLANYLFFGRSSSAFKSSRWVRIRVWILCLLFWLLTVLLDRYVERVSRRMCNLPYVVMVFANNLQIFSILMLGDLVPGRKISILEEAFNRNLLPTFLLANLFTGLINMSINTLSASSFTATCILIVYTLVLSITAGIADFYGIS